MAGLGLGLGLGLARLTGGGGGGPVGEIILSGTDFTATQLETGLLGAFDYGTANQIIFDGANTTSIVCGLAFEFIGTGASIDMRQGAGRPTDMVEVSVDGGAFASAGAASAGKYTLCTALADTTHTIAVRINAAYGTSAHLPSIGNVLTLAGSAPKLVLPVNSQMMTSGQSILASACAFNNAPFGLDVRIPGSIQNPGRISKVVSGAVASRNTTSMRIKTNATKLWIYSDDPYCWINDGTTTTRYTLNGVGNNGVGARLTKLTGFSGLKSYSIWGSQNMNMAVAPFDGLFSSVGTVGRFDEYGDSICAFADGNTAPDFGYAACFQSAVGVGRIGGNFGVAGNTITDLKNRIDLILTNKEVTSFDVAFLTIGRNNIGGAFDATEIADYQYIVSALLTKGYGRVICRGILPEGANLWPAESGSISTIVTGFANAKVVFMNASTFTGLATHDGVHLTVAGANALTAYQVAALPALIGSL